MTLKNGDTWNSSWDDLSSGDISGTNKAYPKSGGPDPDDEDEDDPCTGVLPWSSSKYYYVGDKVTYFGTLYQRTSRGWQNLGRCN